MINSHDLGSYELINSHELKSATFKRRANFSAGPSSLPTDVLIQAQKELLNWNDKGVSVMEVSHRSSDFAAVAQQAQQDLRELMNIPENYKILFLQGGATMQFSAIPLNLMHHSVSATADYLDTGAWSTKAIKEAQRYANNGLGSVNIVASAHNSNYTNIPEYCDWQVSDDASYFHYCANETIHGLQMFDVPAIASSSARADIPIVADMSSCILAHDIDVSKFGMIYAGAQKNIGPAGMVVVIIREDLLGKASVWCPTLLNYEVQTQAESMSNTPATYAWYLSGLVFRWLKAQGGVTAIQEINHKKAQLLYEVIDNSDMYENKVVSKYRSIMNIPFTLNNTQHTGTELDELFLREAEHHGLLFLKGHRSVGGMRASIYNAISLEWVQQLAEFMIYFEKRHG